MKRIVLVVERKPGANGDGQIIHAGELPTVGFGKQVAFEFYKSGGVDADAKVHDTGGVKAVATGPEVSRVLGADAPAARGGVVGGALNQVAPFAGAPSARGTAHDQTERFSGFENGLNHKIIARERC